MLGSRSPAFRPPPLPAQPPPPPPPLRLAKTRTLCEHADEQWLEMSMAGTSSSADRPFDAPSLKVAGKWEGVGVWPVAVPPPPPRVVHVVVCSLDGGYFITVRLLVWMLDPVRCLGWYCRAVFPWHVHLTLSPGLH